MHFIDEVTITVKAGDGGNGCLSFLREAFRPKGGPDGGDGGRGGDVYIRAVAGLDTLLDFAGRPLWEAQNGQHGMGRNCTGRSGKDLIIRVPPGTLIYDAARGNLLADLDKVGAQILIARGGAGGLGNQNFATPSRQSPRITTPGQHGQKRTLRLELKLLAEVGLLGRPNAGKSSLLSRVSRARPKVANYPFTTLKPVLGIVELSDFRRMVFADIPGLIEGAHQGVGLGDGFLRHIERTQVLMHLIDVLPEADPPPLEAYRQIRHELASYSGELAAKPEIIVANKLDLAGAAEAADALEQGLGRPVHRVSTLTGRGLPGLMEAAWRMLHPQQPDPADSISPLSLRLRNRVPPHRRVSAES